MTHTKSLLLFCSVMLVAVAGCGNPVDTAMRGFTEFRGAQHEILVIHDLGPGEMARHNSIQVGRVLSDIGSLVPPEFVVLAQNGTRIQLANLKGLSATGSPIRVIGQITYYQTGGSVQTLMGKDKMAILHVTVSAVDGRKLAEFLVVARSEALRTSDTDLANALALGAAKYFQGKITPPSKR